MGFSLQVLHFNAGDREPGHSSLFRYSGEMNARGHLDFTQVLTVRKEESTWPLQTRIVFDGSVLAYSNEDGEAGHAYAPSFATESLFWRNEIEPQLRLVYAWLHDPFEIPRFQSHRFETSSSGDRTLIEKIATLNDQRYTDLVYEVERSSDGTPRIVSSEIRNPDGGVCERTRFASYREVSSGTWRPMLVDHTVFLQAREDGPRIELRYRFDHAIPLNEQEAAQVGTRPFETDIPWILWMRGE